MSEAIELFEDFPSSVRVTLVMRWLDDGPCTHHSEREIDFLVEGVMAELAWRSETGRYEDELFNDHCLHCGELAPPNATRHAFAAYFFETDTGIPDIGSFYRAAVHEPHSGVSCFEGCDGLHTVVILPTMESWCLEMRAADCSQHRARAHRCFPVNGDLPKITIEKSPCLAEHPQGVTLWSGAIRDGFIV